MRSRLPVEEHAERILAKIKDSRVTLIIGATGCGKSTQVPKIIRRHLGRRVLCVQPRRMAVVAVATRVAEELGEPLGGAEIGYHIGAAKLAELDRTELLFVTAGILLESLKSNGESALTAYGAIVIDEVHERSCENDVALTCLKQLLLHSKELRALKLVLMSATADVSRYSEYMKDLCDNEAPATYALGESSVVFNTTRHFLKDALAIVNDPELSNPQLYEQQDRATGERLCQLIASLVPHLVQRTVSEDGLGCTVLVFLPTYFLIERCHRLLGRSLQEGVPQYVVHSSVDIDDCMVALRGEDGAAARVVLASAVAESSVTMAKVTHVVDTCRACEIHWEPSSGESSPHIVWTSRAQSQQRAGRTGRTNDGTVWQLVTPPRYQQFKEHEPASLQLQLLRREVLLLSCASSKCHTDARRLLGSCLDPPDARTVEHAEAWLRSHRMLEPRPARARSSRPPAPQPSALGRLIDALPIDIGGAQLVLLGAGFGLLDEAVTLAVLRATQPMPLKREPNQQKEYETLVRRYGPAPDPAGDGFKEEELLANFAAFRSFQRWHRDGRLLRWIARRAPVAANASAELEGECVRLHGLKGRAELNGELARVGRFDGARSRYEVTLLSSGESVFVRRVNLVEEEEGWCRERGLSHTALLAVARTRVHVLDTLFRWSPPILQRHLALRKPQPAPRPPPPETAPEGPTEAPPRDPPRDPLPFLFALLVSERSALLLRKLLHTLRRPLHGGEPEESVAPERAPCFFHRRGCCSVGDRCPFPHTKSADQRPLCRLAAQGNCRFGAACRFRHPCRQPAEAALPSAEVALELETLQGQAQLGFGAMMPLFARSELTGAVCGGDAANCLPPPDYLAFSSLLLLGEGDFTFAAALARKCRRSATPDASGSPGALLSAADLLASTDQTEEEVRRVHPAHAPDALASLRADGAATLFSVNARKLDSQEVLERVACVAWNLPFAGVEQAEPNQLLMRALFAALVRNALRRFARGQSPPRLFLTVAINQLADWGLLAAAEDSFLQLDSVHKFEPASYSGYTPVRNNRDDPFDAGELRTFGFSVDEPRLRAADGSAH